MSDSIRLSIPLPPKSLIEGIEPRSRSASMSVVEVARSCAPIEFSLPKKHPVRSSEATGSGIPDPSFHNFIDKDLLNNPVATHASRTSAQSTSTVVGKSDPALYQFIEASQRVGEPALAKAANGAKSRDAIDASAMIDNAARAASVGVNLAKNSCWRKLGGVILTGLVLAVVAATSAALAPATLAVAAVVLVKLAADGACAYMALKNAKAVAAGTTPPFRDMPMGADAVGNLVHKLLPDNWTEAQRQKVAGGVSTGVSLALMVGGGIATADSWISYAAVGTTLTLSLAVLALNRQAATRSADSEAVKKGQVIEEQIEALSDDIGRLQLASAETQSVQDQLESIRDDLQAILMRLGSNLQSQPIPSSNGSGAGKVVGGLAKVVEPAGELVADHGNVDVLEPVVVVIRLVLALRKLYQTTQVNAATDASLVSLNKRMAGLSEEFYRLPGASIA